MEMGVNKRRAQQITAGIDFLRRLQRQVRADSGDAAVFDGNIHPQLSIGQVGVAYHHIHLHSH
jgi:hypothetical protein